MRKDGPFGWKLGKRFQGAMVVFYILAGGIEAVSLVTWLAAGAEEVVGVGTHGGSEGPDGIEVSLPITAAAGQASFPAVKWAAVEVDGISTGESGLAEAAKELKN